MVVVVGGGARLQAKTGRCWRVSKDLLHPCLPIDLLCVSHLICFCVLRPRTRNESTLLKTIKGSLFKNLVVFSYKIDNCLYFRKAILYATAIHDKLLCFIFVNDKLQKY